MAGKVGTQPLAFTVTICRGRFSFLPLVNVARPIVSAYSRSVRFNFRTDDELHG